VRSAAPALRLLGLLGVLGACAGLPPRFNDQTAPDQAYRTFRGALARAEYDREWECISDGLRRRMGLASRADWKDMRVVLGQGHVAIYGIAHSEIEGEPEALSDGRVQFELDLPLAFQGRVVMKPVVVVKVYEEGVTEPAVYYQLPVLDAVVAPTGVVIRLPDDLSQDVGRVGRVIAEVEWFLDDFALGDESPVTVRRATEEAKPKS